MLRAAFLALAMILAPLWGSLASTMPEAAVSVVHLAADHSACSDHASAAPPAAGALHSQACAIACAVPAVPVTAQEPTTARLPYAAVSWPRPTGVAPDRLDWPPPLRPPSL